jgi:hypothetical protein
MLRNPVPSADGLCCPPQMYDKTKRYEPLTGHVVYGYPSNRGILIKPVRAVELLQLNLDRFKEAKRSSDPADEGKFCQRLRQVGAAYWPSEGYRKATTVVETGRRDRLAELGERRLGAQIRCKQMEHESSGFAARSCLKYG